MGRLLVVVLACSLVPLRASASAMPPPTPAVPLPGFVVTGRATVEDVRVAIACAGTNLADDSSLCNVEMHATVRADGDVQIQLPADGRTTIAGDVVTGFVALASGQTMELALSFDRALTIETRDDEGPWILAAPRARHLVLGESSASHHVSDDASGALFGGGEVAIVGPIHVSSAPGAVHARVGGTDVRGAVDVLDPRGVIELRIGADSEPARVLQNGGPFVGVGLWGPLVSDESRFQLRVGYEIALADWVIGSVSFETDFDAIAESVLIEVATPELIVIIPSISVGVGAVARQLGQREADAALRLALGFQVAAMGTYVFFDYWPAIGDWTIAAGGRLSI